VRRLGPQGSLPAHLAVGPAQREQGEIERARLGGRLDGGRQVQDVAPDDGRALSLARERDLPGDILAFAPLDGRPGMRRLAGPERPAPLRKRNDIQRGDSAAIVSVRCARGL
jgi:hypothetical protein